MSKKIEQSMITAVMMHRPYRVKLPEKPKEFLCVEKAMVFDEENIKQIAIDFDLNYTLDYINANVIFEEK